MHETTLNVINPDALLNAFNDLNCGKLNVAELSSKDFEIKQTVTKPLNGYIPPPNFPNCCSTHKRIFQIGVERFDAFPNCCPRHKKLDGANWFKKSNYSYLPYKLVSTISYTWHCIGQCIEKPNWYKEITDYIDYSKNSYGLFPDGFGAPFGAEL